MFRFLGRPPSEARGLTLKAGVRESSKAEPRGGRRDLWSFNARLGPIWTAIAGEMVHVQALTDGITQRGDGAGLLRLSAVVS